MSRAVEHAYDFIHAAIATGRLRRGVHVPEERIAKELGLSRTPVREALRRLEADGLVVISRNSGADVVRMQPDEIAELFRLHDMLEGHAAERAATRIDLAGLDALEDLACRLAVLVRPGEPPDQLQAARLNAGFHLAIARAAESPRLLALIRGLVHVPLAVMHEAGWGERLRRAGGYAEHGRIVQALRRRDPDLARVEMELHILSARPGPDDAPRRVPADGGLAA